MTNIYMSQLIVTEKQKGKHAFIGIKLYKIQLCMPYVLRLEIKSSNCSFINIPSPHFSRFCYSLKFHWDLNLGKDSVNINVWDTCIALKNVLSFDQFIDTIHKKKLLFNIYWVKQQYLMLNRIIFKISFCYSNIYRFLISVFFPLISCCTQCLNENYNI